jgi:hypothetical protein
MGADKRRLSAVGKVRLNNARLRALASVVVLSIVLAFANFLWTGHVVDSSYHRWCSSLGYIGNLPLIDVPGTDTSLHQVAVEMNDVIMYFRLRSQQLSCSHKQG